MEVSGKLRTVYIEHNLAQHGQISPPESKARAPPREADTPRSMHRRCYLKDGTVGRHWCALKPCKAQGHPKTPSVTPRMSHWHM